MGAPGFAGEDNVTDKIGNESMDWYHGSVCPGYQPGFATCHCSAVFAGANAVQKQEPLWAPNRLAPRYTDGLGSRHTHAFQMGSPAMTDRLMDARPSLCAAIGSSRTGNAN